MKLACRALQKAHKADRTTGCRHRGQMALACGESKENTTGGHIGAADTDYFKFSLHAGIIHANRRVTWL